MYLYLLDIDDKDKDIIITRSEKLLWNLIPFTEEAFAELCRNYPDYEICELDSRFLRHQADRHNYLNMN
jgi:hypothetical protein